MSEKEIFGTKTLLQLHKTEIQQSWANYVT